MKMGVGQNQNQELDSQVLVLGKPFADRASHFGVTLFLTRSQMVDWAIQGIILSCLSNGLRLHLGLGPPRTMVDPEP